MNTTTDPANAGGLLLKLYELRTDPELRRARSWFVFEFHPSSARDILATWLGPGHLSAPYRMVTTYWDMAASLVVSGAIPAEMFNEANTEHFGVFAKMRPYLNEVRAATNYPDYLINIEKVIEMKESVRIVWGSSRSTWLDSAFSPKKGSRNRCTPIRFFPAHNRDKDDSNFTFADAARRRLDSNRTGAAHAARLCARQAAERPQCDLPCRSRRTDRRREYVV